jgi:hypothetical protein
MASTVAAYPNSDAWSSAKIRQALSVKTLTLSKRIPANLIPALLDLAGLVLFLAALFMVKA